MIIKGKTVIVYDIEVFPNFFHCTCKDTESNELYLFEISERKTQISELTDFFLNKDRLFCGYNNHHYDDTLVNYIVDYCSLLEQKHWIIDNN